MLVSGNRAGLPGTVASTAQRTPSGVEGAAADGRQAASAIGAPPLKEEHAVVLWRKQQDLGKNSIAHEIHKTKT